MKKEDKFRMYKNAWEEVACLSTGEPPKRRFEIVGREDGIAGLRTPLQFQGDEIFPIHDMIFDNLIAKAPFKYPGSQWRNAFHARGGAELIYVGAQGRYILLSTGIIAEPQEVDWDNLKLWVSKRLL